MKVNGSMRYGISLCPYKGYMKMGTTGIAQASSGAPFQIVAVRRAVVEVSHEPWSVQQVNALLSQIRGSG